MTLTKQNAFGTVIGTVGLVAMLTNPNCDFKDFKEPQAIYQKWESNASYEKSGRVYVLGGLAFLTTAACLGYNALTGRLKKREDEE